MQQQTEEVQSSVGCIMKDSEKNVEGRDLPTPKTQLNEDMRTTIVEIMLNTMSEAR